MLVCTGKLHLEPITGFLKLKFSTEETVVEEDWLELKFSLVMKNAVKSSQEHKTENGILLNAKTQYLVTRLS